MPTLARANIGRTRVWQESTFGADPSGSIGSFGDLRLVEHPTGMPDPEMLADARVRQNVHENYADVVGFKKGDGVGLKGYLCGSGQTLNAAATPTQTTICKVLEKVVGAYQADAGSAYASAASSTGVTVTAGQGSRMLPGKLIAIESASGSGLFCVRKVETRSTDAITWNMATGLGSTAFTIASGCRILGSLQIYPINAPSGATGLAFAIESEDRAQVFWLAGALPSAFGIDWTLGKDLMWNATMQAARLFLDSSGGTSEVTSSIAGSAISAATYDDGARCVATAGSCWFATKASTTLTAPHISEFSFSPGTKWVGGDTFNGVEGRGYYEYLPDYATCTITVPYDAAYETGKRANTAYQLLIQAGQTAGGIVALNMPNCFIRSAKEVVKNGLRRHQLTLVAMQDTASTTALSTAPWRLGFM